MKTANRTTPADRNRALGRLRSMTIGTALAGLAAVGAFGTVAAISYSGHSTGTSADLETSSSDTSSSVGTTTSSTSATATPAATIQPASTSATTTTGGGQVTTGGS